VIADRTAYNARYRYTYRPLAEIGMISKSFTYLQFQSKVCFWCRKSAADGSHLLQAFSRSLSAFPL